MYFNMTEMEKAHQYAQSAIDLLENEHHPLLSAEVFALQGSLYYFEKNRKSALFYYDLALDKIKTNSAWNIYLEVQENRGMIHHQLGNYAESNEAFLKALPLEHKRKNYPSISSILQQLAINCERMGEGSQALKYMKDSLKKMVKGIIIY